MTRISRNLLAAVWMCAAMAACDGEMGGPAREAAFDGGVAMGPGAAATTVPLEGWLERCDLAPLDCPAGTTCWLVSDGRSHACLPSGGGQIGKACLNTPGAPVCADGLTCRIGIGETAGRCLPYCDDAHACPDGSACGAWSVIGTWTVQHVCE